MRHARAAITRIRRLFRPARIVAVTRRPAGWLVVGRRRLHDVVAWGQLEDGAVVGLVADRRGLRPATGRHFHGYLPGAAHSSSDIQLSPPAVSVPVADVVEAIGDPSDTRTPEAQGAILERLAMAVEDEWASRAFLEFAASPERFLRRHFELIVEHMHPAELAADERQWLAGLHNTKEKS